MDTRNKQIDLEELIAELTKDSGDENKISSHEIPASYQHEPTEGPVEEQEEAAYPHEAPLPENVEVLDNFTLHDLPVVEILRSAYNAGLVEMVVVGVSKDGDEVLLRTNADAANAMWHLMRGVHNLNVEMDRR